MLEENRRQAKRLRAFVMSTTSLVAVLSVSSTSLAEPIRETAIIGTNGDDTIVETGIDLSLIGDEDVTAIGVNSRRGNDTVNIEGVFKTSASASSSELDLFTIDIASPALMVEGTAIGLLGGSGDDMLISNGGDVLSSAKGNILDFAIIQENPDDLLSLNIGSLIDARSIGLNGGSGVDRLENNGALRAEAVAEGKHDNINLIGIDVIDFSSVMFVNALATGLLGGSDENTFLSTANISAISNAQALLNATEFGLLSATTGNGEVTATARSTGIQGGRSDDTVTSSGGLEIRSNAVLENTGETVSLVDVGTFDRSGEGRAFSYGVNTSGGNDTITLNNGVLSIAASVDLNSTTISMTVAGANLGDASFDGLARASGIASGAENDVVTIADMASLDVDATANRRIVDISLTALDISEAVSSEPSTQKNVIRAIAEGVSLGSGDDQVNALGGIDVAALSDVSSIGVAMTVEAVPKLDWTDTHVDVDMQANAVVDGLAGGGGMDQLFSAGDLISNATAISKTDVASVSFPLDLPVPGLGAAGSAFVFLSAGSEARANAQGLDGGGEDDELRYGGLNLNVDSTAEATSTLVFLDAAVTVFDSPFTLPTAEFALLKSTANANALGEGLVGGAGNDRIFLDAGAIGYVTSIANATNTAVSVEMGLNLTKQTPDDVVNLGINLSGFDTRARSVANAFGIDGGAGDDVIFNFGSMTVLSDSNAKSGSYRGGARIFSDGLDVDGVFMSNRVDARANARGIAGGSGADTLLNIGSLNTTANATGILESVNASLNFSNSPIGAFSIGTVIFDTAAIVRSSAIGIEGQSGATGTENRGTLTTTAMSGASNLGIITSVDTALFGASLNTGVMQTDLSSSAVAYGVRSSGPGVLSNSGQLTTNADAGAQSTSVDATIAITKDIGLVGGVAVQTSQTDAVATVYGLWGTNDSVLVQNTGVADASADAFSDAIAVDVDVQATTSGLGFDIAVLDTTTEARATSTGLGGSGDIVKVENTNDVTVQATSNADATSVTSGLTVVPSAGFVLSGALADASTTARSTGFGIRALGNSAELLNDGDVSVTSTSMANADAINVSAAFVGTGLAIDVAAVEANSRSDARAYGIFSNTTSDTDIGNDTLRNMAGLSVLADANADSDSIAISVDGTLAGVTIGAGVVEGDARAKSVATGMQSGAGNDLIEFSPLVSDDPTAPIPVTSVKSLAGVSMTGVAVDIDVAAQGAAVSNAIVLATSNADADAVGYDAGDGIDNLYIRGDTEVDAEASISGTTASISLAGAGVGASGGVAWVDLKQTADARADGLRGGDGADELLNQAKLSTNAVSDVRGTGVSVGGSLTLTGAALGASVADVTNTSKSQAVGMAGQRFAANGSDSNIVSNSGDSTTNAVSVASSKSIAVQGNVAFVPVGMALANASTTADAHAKGMAGSGGNDFITNDGSLSVYGRATASGTSVGASLSGAGLGDVSTRAIAEAHGVDAGAGFDRININGSLNALAKATTGTQSINVTGLGLSGSKTDTYASATSTGVVAGAGADIVNVSDVVLVEAITRNHTAVDEDGLTEVVGAGALNFNWNLVGVALEDAGTTFEAVAVGVDGGADNDTITIAGPSLTSLATSNLRQESVVIQGAGAIIGDVGLTSTAESIGVDAGNGVNTALNSSILTSAATATAQSNSISFQGIGFESDFGSLKAVSTAKGLTGGNNDDRLTNDLVIDVDAIASVQNNGVDVRLIGGGSGSSNSNATAMAYGLDGGAGADTLVNRGIIDVLSRTRTTTSNVSASVLDVSFLNSTRFSNSTAIGINGDRGNDGIINSGSITAVADATLSNQSVTVNVAGGGRSVASIDATATAKGIDAGAGNDVVFLELGSDIDAISCAAAIFDVNTQTCAPGISETVRINLVGGTRSEGELVHRAVSTGVDLGSGTDFISSLGDIFSFAATDVRSGSLSITGLGYTGEASDSAATAFATGVFGGDGNDTINLGDRAYARSIANLAAASSDVTLVGYTSGDFIFGSTATATSADGGQGNDNILFDGNLLKAFSTATVASSSDRVNFAGGISVSSILTGASVARGLSGGDGNDSLTLSGLSDIDAHSDVRISGTTAQYTGGTVTGGGVTAESTAYGAAGDAGNDVIIFNTGSEQSVLAKGAVVASSGSQIRYGSSRSTGGSAATAIAYGADGGAGDDIIRTNGVISVTSDTGSTARSVSYVQVGASRAELTAKAVSTATGIAGGTGVNDITNIGDVFVFANSRSVGTDSSIVGASVSTASRSGADTESRATATGISGGDQRDIINNTGLIDVEARAGSTISNSASAGGVWVKSQTNSHVFSYMTAKGITSGASENDFVRNEGTIQVDLSRGGGTERTRADSKSGNGSPISINSDAGAYAVASMNDLRGFGIEMGAGNGVIENTGSISVVVETLAVAAAETNPNGLSGADGSSTAVVGVSGAVISGIEAIGGGDKTVLNDGNIFARLHPGAAAATSADADGINFGSEPDAKTSSFISLNNNRAYGVHVGTGDDTVTNNGDITVQNVVYANRARAVSGPGGGIESVDAFATARASVNGAYGYGILADDGSNLVVNNGAINVLVSPLVEASTSATGRAFDGDAEATSTATIENASGFGISTGSGVDTIINTGTISVHLDPVMVAGAAVKRGTHPLGNGESVRRATESATSIFSIGIFSGNGNDYVLNEGTVKTTRTRGSGNVLAISTAGGDDIVELGAVSQTLASIDLSSGDDRLIVHGGALFNGALLGGGGVDTLELVGAGTFSVSDVRVWENLTKSGAGHFRVTSPVAWQDLVINEGTLTATVIPTATAGLETFVDGSGRAGTFETAVGYRLGGVFKLNAGPNPLSDNQRFRLINANSLTYAPSTENLPTPTPLLSFSVAPALNTVDAIASVNAFSSAAATPDQIALSQSFDDMLLAGDPTFYDTDLAYALGSIQKLPSVSDIQAAYDAFIPSVASPDAPAITAVANGASDVVQDTLSFARHTLRSDDKAVQRLGYTGVAFADSSNGRVWVADLSGNLGVNPLGAEQFYDDGKRSFVSGVNLPLGETSIVGISLGMNSLSAPQLSGRDTRDEDKFASIYGLHMFNDKLFLEGVSGYSLLGAREKEHEGCHVFARSYIRACTKFIQ